MAFEQVILRTADGQQYGPITMVELVQWQREGRVPPDAVLVDTVSGEEKPMQAFSALIVPPPPGAIPPPFAQEGSSSEVSGMDRLIPMKNTPALLAYYCGIFGLIPCFTAILGPAALVLGILGLRKVEATGVGKGHAIAGIVLGGLETLALVAGIVFLILNGQR